VGQSLERLALWRAAHSSARADRTSGGQPLSFLFKIIWGKKQDKVLFKVYLHRMLMCAVQHIGSRTCTLRLIVALINKIFWGNKQDKVLFKVKLGKNIHL
jgi:hypothetical protein